MVYSYPNIHLMIYDLIMFLGCKYIWKCPTSLQLNFFNKYLSSNHLDIGVGSGWNLQYCQFPSHMKRLMLADMNLSPIKFAITRLLDRFRNQKGLPKLELMQWNILQDLPFTQEHINKFDSISMFFLLHCVPGTMKEKIANIFPKLKEILTKDGVIYGTTILGNMLRNDRKPSYLAYIFCTIANYLAVGDNWNDDVESLKEVAQNVGFNIQVNVIGYVAFFELRHQN